MIDFYLQLRQHMIETMQNSLKQVRQELGFGVQEFGDVIGLTRQTINNLENSKSKMSATQYVAICAVIDNCLKDMPEKLPIFSALLSFKNDEDSETVFENVQDGSFLKKWFQCFPDESKIITFSPGGNNIFLEEDMENIAENYRVFLDGSSLCEDGFADAVKPLAADMLARGHKFIVPLKVIEDIQNLMIDFENTNENSAKKAMNLLVHMQSEGLIEIRGEKSDFNTVSTFISVFAKFKCVNRIALITQDIKLAKQVLMLNNDDIGGFNILVLRCNSKAQICQWKDEDFEDKIAELQDDINVKPEMPEEELKSDTQEETNEEQEDKDPNSILRGWETID